MIHEVTMPAMGADMTEGTVVKWLKSEGDEVARGDKLAEIETDKTVVEMEAYNAGILRRIVLGDGTKAPVGSLLAYIGGADDVLPEMDDAPASAAVEEPSEPEPAVELQVEAAAPEPQPAPEPAASAPVAAPPAPTVDGGRIKASPLARRLAREHGYDLGAIPGTGPGGRITRDDVLGFTPAPAFAPSGVTEAPPAVTVDGSDIELTTMRQAIARVTVRSKTEAPHYYVTSGVDMTEAMSFRAQLNAELVESGVRVSVNDMIIKALAMAIVEYPKWNTTFHEDRLEGHDSINIGVAIALEAGLIVPALIGVQNMSLVDVANASKDLGARARGEGGSLTQEELTAGTFSTSNLGMFGTDTFAAIIVPPQAGILAVGAVKPTPVVMDDEIVVRQMMNATISADHRVGDGAEAATLLNEVKDNLERPLRLIL
ncbi:MAG: 2-oxo acid dehydrogenase subunit E2 [Chloroflexi bacterium]|nr:2-oxo acid dehydrogenase subunit E2 [Chloroflexota bacterium]MYK61529.1 2-oxo acid dehydrogenase subunit E2 [Chloroflexota bacterium]